MGKMVKVVSYVLGSVWGKHWKSTHRNLALSSEYLCVFFKKKILFCPSSFFKTLKKSK